MDIKLFDLIYYYCFTGNSGVCQGGPFPVMATAVYLTEMSVIENLYNCLGLDTHALFPSFSILSSNLTRQSSMTRPIERHARLSLLLLSAFAFPTGPLPLPPSFSLLLRCYSGCVQSDEWFTIIRYYNCLKIIIICIWYICKLLGYIYGTESMGQKELGKKIW